MSGISSKALNGTPENKYKYNGIEKENAFEIGIYDAQLRELDGQTGRWWQIDPKTENMEMWSPYASNYDNPITYMDPLGDEPSGDGCCGWLGDALIDAGKSLLISASGVVNGALNTVTGGIISSDPFNLRSRLNDEELQLYDNSVTVGKIGPLFIPGSSRSTKSPPMELVPAGGGKAPVVSVKITPATPKVAPLLQQNSTNSKGGGKNAQHANQKAKQAAKEKYEAAKLEYETLKSKPNKTKEDVQAKDAAERQMKHWKQKMEFAGENHSQQAKGK